MLSYDTRFVLLAHADRVEALRRSAAPAGTRRRRHLRRRLGGWLITIGVRLAAEPPRRSTSPA
jgi:hypothetical protein